jgi:hypothetical protein
MAQEDIRELGTGKLTAEMPAGPVYSTSARFQNNLERA